MLVANSRELRFIIIGSDFKWESIMAAKTKMFAVSGRAWPMWRGLPSIDLNRNISQASLLLCKHNKKLHKSKTSNLNTKPAWYILKRGHELRNSLAGGTGKTLFGAATTVVDKRNNKRSIGIMIFLMDAVLASIFWLEDAPIDTSNTIYVIYTLRKAYHILSNLSVN